MKRKFYNVHGICCFDGFSKKGRRTSHLPVAVNGCLESAPKASKIEEKGRYGLTSPQFHFSFLRKGVI